MCERPDTFTLGITTTQSVESLNNHNLKSPIVRASSFCDMILTLSCCTREFIQKVHNHIKHNNIHREANLVHGFVNKVNEHILKMIVQAKHYYVEDVT